MTTYRFHDYRDLAALRMELVVGAMLTISFRFPDALKTHRRDQFIGTLHPISSPALTACWPGV